MMRSTTLLIVSVSAAALCAAAMSGCNVVVQAQPSTSTTTETDDTRGNTSTSRTVIVSGDGTRKTTVIVNGKVVEDSISGGRHTNTPPRIVEKSVPAASVQTVEVRSDFGGITFASASDAAQISVRAEITLSDSRLSEADRKKYLAGFTVETETEGGKLRIYAKPPGDFPKNRGWRASFRVGVPSGTGLALDAKTSNGAVIVGNTKTTGDVSARSDFGEVRITNAGGSGAKIEARTSNGAVSVKNDAFVQTVSARSDFGSITVSGQADTIEARTSNGAVTVRGAKNARTVSAHSDYGSVTVRDCGGTVEAVTSNGAVTVDGTPEHLTGKSDFGSVHATLQDGTTPQEINLSTSNGSVNLKAPASASLRITARTTNGHITTSGDGVQGKSTGDNFNKSFDGTIGSGTSPVSLRTDFGSISITAR